MSPRLKGIQDDRAGTRRSEKHRQPSEMNNLVVLHETEALVFRLVVQCGTPRLRVLLLNLPGSTFGTASGRDEAVPYSLRADQPQQQELS